MRGTFDLGDTLPEGIVFVRSALINRLDDDPVSWCVGHDSSGGFVAEDLEDLLLPHAHTTEGATHIDLDGIPLVTPRTDVNRELVRQGEQQAALGPEDALPDVADLGEQLGTHELEAHERIDVARNQRADGVVVRIRDFRRPEERLNLRSSDCSNQQLAVLNGLRGGEEEPGIPQLCDRQVGVGGCASLHVVDRDDRGGREGHLSRAIFASVGDCERSVYDHLIHRTAHCVNRIGRGGRGGIGEHPELVLLVDEVRPVKVAHADLTAIKARGVEWSIGVAREDLLSGGRGHTIVELKLSILALDSHIRAKPRTFLLVLNLDVAPVSIYQSGFNLKRHERLCLLLRRRSGRAALTDSS